MILTIIETGKAPDAIRDRFASYPVMFEQLIRPAAPGLEYQTIALTDGAPLPDPAGLDAVLITGSPAGVYDPEPWMPALMDFIRWTAAENTPQVGICFGHQAMAHALGGHAGKSDRGWGVGRHSYEISMRPGWMDAGDMFALAVSHQDQVLTPPPGARSVAASAFTPFAALDYQTCPAISLQGHPEFSDEFAEALYTARRDRLGDETTETALASLNTPHDNARAARWIAAFLDRAGTDSSA